MNFKVVEGQDNIDYDAILRDYQNLDLSVKTIREKYNLSIGRWNTIIRKFKEDNIPLRSNKKQSPRTYNGIHHIGAKNYYYNKKTGKYRITKRIDGRIRYFGSVDSEEEAIDRVCELRESNWDGLL